MLGKGEFINGQWEALLDEELSLEEQQEFETYLASSDSLDKMKEQGLQELNIIQHHLKSHVEDVTDSINFDSFYAKLSSKIERQEKTQTTYIDEGVSEVAESLMTKLRRLFASHPSIPFACASAVIVALVFALPFLDPGPAPNDCVVDKVTSSKSSQVAVLQTKTQKTGQRMTVIVINEPFETLPPVKTKTPKEKSDKHSDKDQP